MRTKTLLLAAAISVAGLVSSQADAVFSQNVVGYINVSVASGKFTFLGNQLVNGTDVAKTNNNIQTLQTGMVSDPNGASNTVLYWWNGNGYNIYTYYKNADAAQQFDPTFGDGWYTGSGGFANVALNQGAGGGHFLKNRSTASMTVTLVGQVLQGTNQYTISQGFNTFTIAEPISTNLDAALLNFPATSDPNGALNDVYYHYNGTGYDILTYYKNADAAQQFDPTFGDGWYTGSGAFGSTNTAFWPKVAEGFFINHRTATPVTWTNVFNVQ